MSDGPQMHVRYDRTLRIARAIVGATSKRAAISSEQIQSARHMAHAGATPEEIAAAAGWIATPRTIRNWLKRLNIRINNKLRRSPHLGDETYLPNSQRGNDTRVYRPRSRA